MELSESKKQELCSHIKEAKKHLEELEYILKGEYGDNRRNYRDYRGYDDYDYRGGGRYGSY